MKVTIAIILMLEHYKRCHVCSSFSLRVTVLLDCLDLGFCELSDQEEVNFSRKNSFSSRRYAMTPSGREAT